MHSLQAHCGKLNRLLKGVGLCQGMKLVHMMGKCSLVSEAWLTQLAKAYHQPHLLGCDHRACRNTDVCMPSVALLCVVLHAEAKQQVCQDTKLALCYLLAA